MRIGLGYDIHQLSAERDLILGGVKIPHNLGLLGHSDADVLVHAIIDALLGSLALGDIGSHFSDNDEKYKNIDSLILLNETNELIKKQNYKIINIDSNIICQKPKLAPYINQMREKIANTLLIDVSCISIKAKTNEKMDSMGQERSISANAAVLVEKII